MFVNMDAAKANEMIYGGNNKCRMNRLLRGRAYHVPPRAAQKGAIPSRLNAKEAISILKCVHHARRAESTSRPFRGHKRRVGCTGAARRMETNHN